MRIYHGQSMKGTFDEGDFLTLEKISVHNVQPGDIIIFERSRSRKGTKEIVHRVLRRVHGGVVTRGDAVAYEDAGLVNDENLIGRVCSKERNGRISRVYGGWIGICRGRALYFYWGTRRKLVRLVRRPYELLRATGLVRFFWKPRITRLMINSPEASYIQFICNKRVVARYWPDTGAFKCRKPWDLVIDYSQTTSKNFQEFRI